MSNVNEGRSGAAEAVFETAAEWLERGRRLAWATVISTWRSSPRPVGSQLLIADDGSFAGSVSGGCVEGAVIQAAAGLFQGQPARTLAYGVSSEQAWDVGLPCGGKLEVFLSLVPEPLLARVLEARRRREGVAWVSDLESGEQTECGPDAELPEPLAELLAAERSGVVEVAGKRLFLHVVAAAPRLVVVGAGHLTQALCSMASGLGFELSVIDPRTAFATAERFPGVKLSHDWPDEALTRLPLDASTAVVVLSHDEKLDEPALEVALRSECFYIGALGSQRTQEARRRRLSALGFGPEQLARIHGPVGLDIGAVTTPEMAISILAEIIRARRGPKRSKTPR